MISEYCQRSCQCYQHRSFDLRVAGVLGLAILIWVERVGLVVVGGYRNFN
jgi:hypothetical protein